MQNKVQLAHVSRGKYVLFTLTQRKITFLQYELAHKRKCLKVFSGERVSSVLFLEFLISKIFPKILAVHSIVDSSLNTL